MAFSPTGNTLYLANILKNKLNCELLNVDDEINTNHLIIMSSIHAFKVPIFLKDKISNIKKISIICVGCNTSKINSAAGYHLIKKANKKGVEIKNYKILAMPITIAKKFDENYGHKIVNESINEINVIYNNIINDKSDIIKVPFLYKIISNIHYIEKIFVKLFGLELKANKKCIRCKLCINNCPKKNIKIQNKIKFGFKCMMCMKCIYCCPVKAIHPRFSKFLELKDGYDLKKYLKK